MTSTVRILHAIPGAPAVNVYLNSVLTVRDLSYSQITNYIDIRGGLFAVEVRVASTGTVVLSQSYVLGSGRYTIAAAGMDASSASLYKYDDNPSDIPGYASVSFVNLSPDSPPVDVYINSVLAFRNVTFGGSSYLTYYPVNLGGNNSIQVRVVGTYNRQPIFGPATVGAVTGSSETLYMIGTVTNLTFPVSLVVASTESNPGAPVGTGLNGLPGVNPINGRFGVDPIDSINRTTVGTGPLGNPFVNQNTLINTPQGAVDINRFGVNTPQGALGRTVVRASTNGANDQNNLQGDTSINGVVMQPLPDRSQGTSNSWVGYKPRGLQRNFDISRYMGTWYQTASIPQFFNLRCARSEAEYRLRRDGTVAVKNICYNKNMEVVGTINGQAKVVDPNQPAALRVTFEGPIGGENMIPPGPNYLVHKTDYTSYALVGSPDRTSLFFLSRKKYMCQSTYDRLVKLASRLGYDTSKIKIDLKGVKSSC